MIIKVWVGSIHPPQYRPGGNSFSPNSWTFKDRRGLSLMVTLCEMRPSAINGVGLFPGTVTGRFSRSAVTSSPLGRNGVPPYLIPHFLSHTGPPGDGSGAHSPNSLFLYWVSNVSTGTNGSTALMELPARSA